MERMSALSPAPRRSLRVSARKEVAEKSPETEAEEKPQRTEPSENELLRMETEDELEVLSTGERDNLEKMLEEEMRAEGSERSSEPVGEGSLTGPAVSRLESLSLTEEKEPEPEVEAPPTLEHATEEAPPGESLPAGSEPRREVELPDSRPIERQESREQQPPEGEERPTTLRQLRRQTGAMPDLLRGSGLGFPAGSSPSKRIGRLRQSRPLEGKENGQAGRADRAGIITITSAAFLRPKPMTEKNWEQEGSVRSSASGGRSQNRETSSTKRKTRRGSRGSRRSRKQTSEDNPRRQVQMSDYVSANPELRGQDELSEAGEPIRRGATRTPRDGVGRPVDERQAERFPIRTTGIVFRDVDLIPTHPCLDPPPYACFSCWQRGHAASNCPKPTHFAYCRNRGRREVTILTCPRCSEGYKRYRVQRRREEEDRRRNESREAEEGREGERVFRAQLPVEAREAFRRSASELRRAARSSGGVREDERRDQPREKESQERDEGIRARSPRLRSAHTIRVEQPPVSELPVRPVTGETEDAQRQRERSLRAERDIKWPAEYARQFEHLAERLEPYDRELRESILRSIFMSRRSH